MKRDDPLNELLLPAYDLAVRIRDGEKVGRASECLLSGALLVLLAERDAMWTLIRQKDHKIAADKEFIRVLKEEADAATLDRVRGYFALRNTEIVEA